MQGIRRARKHRVPSLTPMVDVVFLLLVFFMLASRFGGERAIPLPLSGSGESYSGPPRLVEIGPGNVALNGVALPPEDLPMRLEALSESPQDTVILQGRDGATLQRVVDVTWLLNRAGFTTLVLVE